MDSSWRVCRVERYQKKFCLTINNLHYDLSKPLHLPGALGPLCMQHWQLKIKWSLVFETLERWLLFILIIVAEALLICRHQGSGCCFSCTAKFHRNRFSCPKCQGRSFTLVSSTLPCWTIYSRWSLTVSLTTQQVELCSEGNSWSQSTRTGRISLGCWTPGHLHTWTSRWSWRETFGCL